MTERRQPAPKDSEGAIALVLLLAVSTAAGLALGLVVEALI
jgi:hypothetical protein